MILMLFDTEDLIIHIRTCRYSSYWDSDILVI